VGRQPAGYAHGARLYQHGFVDQGLCASGLAQYLRNQWINAKPTALYTLTRSGVHRDSMTSPTDPRVLVAALHKVKGDTSNWSTARKSGSRDGSANPDGSAGVDPGAVQTEAQKIQTIDGRFGTEFQSFQQRLAITTLGGNATGGTSIGRIPRRKSLIWASGGFPFSVSDNTMQLAPAGRDSLSDVLPLYNIPATVERRRNCALPGGREGAAGCDYASASVRIREKTTRAT